MLRLLTIGVLAAVAISCTASAEAPPQFELGLDCAAAATVSGMIFRETSAPQELQESYNSIMLSAIESLHQTAPDAGLSDDEVDLEIVRRADLLVAHLNGLTDDAYRDAVFRQISLEPDGGMAACSQLGNASGAEALPRS